jgi:hypothetical protein
MRIPAFKVLEECGANVGKGPWFLFLATLLAFGAGLYLLLYLHAKTMLRAYKISAHNAIQRSFQHYLTTGEITNFHELATVFIFTNCYTIKAKTHECVLGMLWGRPGDKRYLVAITKEGITLWLERTNAPEVMEFSR